MKLFSILVCFLLVAAVTLDAAVTYPKVFHDYTCELAGQRFGITETEKVVTEEFQQRIVPGKQIIVSLGLTYFVMALSLNRFLILASILFVCLGTGVFLWRKSGKRGQRKKLTVHDQPQS